VSEEDEDVVDEAEEDSLSEMSRTAIGGGGGDFGDTRRFLFVETVSRQRIRTQPLAEESWRTGCCFAFGRPSDLQALVHLRYTSRIT
jgi:hypothetical protein